MSTPDLQRKARELGEQFNDLLNRTLLDGPRLTTITNTTGTRAFIGYGIRKDDVVPQRAMPITVSASPAQIYLHAYHVLTLEPDTGYLTTARSDAGVYADAEKQECLLRYDYERDKADGYPESHLHVYGQADILGTTVGGLHFPTGGRRFRPGLEELVDFLVTEGLADAKDGWETVVEQHRQEFYELQLRDAARRDPEVAQQGIDSLPPPA